MPDQPSKIGRYQVLRTLGQGAMGTVYLAEDPMLKRRLAIKVVRASGEERAAALDRFKREAEISAQLNHPNVVTIYDVGTEPDIGPFLAMEYVEGRSLGKIIRENALEPEMAFGILIQAMRALRAAHRHAIIHRDVKPENILVSEEGRVKLMDFGIARTMAPRLTAAGEFLGSPAYSAPELLKGMEPTPSSDRYAFAVTAFEVLLGQLPHPGNSVAAVVTHVLHEMPAMPPDTSRELGDVFRKALAKDPDDRYENLMEFLDALVVAFPMDLGARERLEETLMKEDHAGDIVPLRRLRSRPVRPLEPAPGVSSSSGARSSSGRTQGMPMLTPSMSMKIELEADAFKNPRATAPRMPRVQPREAPSGLDPKRLLKWIIIILLGGQLFWILYGFLQPYLRSVGQ